jgi:uncharacterized protein
VTPLEELSQAEYVSLATFRKNGKEVATPIWAAEENGVFYMFSEAKAGKVKRLKNSPRARMATCTVKGQVTGDWYDAKATIVSSEEEIQTAYRALRRKYGWKMFLVDIGSKLAGKYQKRALLRIVLDD